MAMNCAPNARASSRASVVLPTPGGPQKIIECGLPAASATASGLPSPRRWRWPTTSSTRLGRNRSASGTLASPLAEKRSGASIIGGEIDRNQTGRACPWVS